MDLTLVKKLKEHIKKELKKKYTPKEIETSLLRAGFDKASVRQAFTELKIKQPSFMEGLFASKPSKKKKTVKEKKETKVEKPKKPAKKIGTFWKVPNSQNKSSAKKDSFFSNLFKHEAKKPVPKKPVKVFPPKKPKVEAKKPTKKKESFFSKLFKPKKKQVPTKVILPKKVVVRKPKIPPIPIKKNKRKRILAFSFGIVLIILIVCIIAVLFFSPTGCATEECFLDLANKCKAATYTNIIDGTTIQYRVNNCVLKKTVLDVSADEMPEIIKAFKDKSMTCLYAKDDFSPVHIYTLSGMLNTCEGELKTAILPYTLQ